MKANYVIATWSGERLSHVYHDPVIRLSAHINHLYAVHHDLSQITIVVPYNPEEPVAFTTYINSLPKTIENTKVVVLRRPK